VADAPFFRISYFSVTDRRLASENTPFPGAKEEDNGAQRMVLASSIVSLFCFLCRCLGARARAVLVGAALIFAAARRLLRSPQRLPFPLAKRTTHKHETPHTEDARDRERRHNTRAVHPSVGDLFASLCGQESCEQRRQGKAA
jgi:hypothetical protein